MSRGEGCVEIVITMVSLANLQMQSCRCDDVENILTVVDGEKELSKGSNPCEITF